MLRITDITSRMTRVWSRLITARSLFAAAVRSFSTSPARKILEKVESLSHIDAPSQAGGAVIFSMTIATVLGYGHLRRSTSKGNMEREEPEPADREAFLRFSGNKDEEMRVQYNNLLKRYLEEGRVQELFQIWKEKYNKVYKNAEEEKNKFLFFENHLKWLVKRNPEWHYAMVLGFFADNSPEEWKSISNPGLVCDEVYGDDEMLRRFGTVSHWEKNKKILNSSLPSATVAVDKATGDLLSLPDCSTNIYICHSVNFDHWQAQDVVEAVKKRLQHDNPKVQLLTLRLLDSIVNNCGYRVHFQIMEKNILGEMVKIVKKKPDIRVRDKILTLLGMWHWEEIFCESVTKHPHYCFAYEELRRSGVQLPRHSLAPVISVPASVPTSGTAEAGSGMSSTTRRIDETMETEFKGSSLSNMEAMPTITGDMLQVVNLSDKKAVKDEVIADIVPLVSNGSNGQIDEDEEEEQKDGLARRHSKAQSIPKSPSSV